MLVAALAGCQTLPPPVPENAPARHQLDVPFHPQDKYQCGPAALAMALGAAGHEVAPATLIDEVWLPQRKGSLAIELRAAARTRERLVYPVNTPEALFTQLDAGYPVLVMQNLAFSFWPQWHFAVVIGYEEDGQRMILHTGTNRADPSHWNRFVRTWARADYQGMVILPPGKLPAHGEPRNLVQALNDLQHSAGTEAALPYWQTAVQQWPEEYLMQFGWGNLQWNRGEKKDAIRAFRKAVEIRPDAASAWNNLAEAWRQSGCKEQARDTIKKALALEPDRNTFQDTRNRIEQMPEADCSFNASISAMEDPTP